MSAFGVCEIRRPEKREGADSKFTPLQKGYDAPRQKCKQEGAPKWRALRCLLLSLKGRNFLEKQYSDER
jgi:hypothetical protein